MAGVNTKTHYACERTHEGAVASRISNLEQLKRSTMACMLWEDTFYEDGVSIADRIKDLVKKVGETDSRQVMYDAKDKQKLRHLPLYMIVLFARNRWIKKEDVVHIITRADDMTELLALYWQEGKCPLSRQMVKGLKLAFTKFNEYALAKYNRPKEVKLKDVLKIVRPKPATKEQEELWGKLLHDELATPDTWEVAISACNNPQDKKKEFTRLLEENKLGDLAFIRNLRKMLEVGVDDAIIKNYFSTRKWGKILPYQFITSARYAPQFEPLLEEAMFACLNDYDPIEGSVNLLVDISGSMNVPISEKSDVSRCDVACSLAILLREICKDINVYSFSNELKLVPARRGFALRDAIMNSQYHLGTNLWEALEESGKSKHSSLTIVITDEQTADNGACKDANTDFLAIVNVGTYKNGVGYGKGSIHINGWSESVVDYLQNYLKSFQKALD